MQKLKTGVAYHGNRMLSSAIAHMNEIAAADMDIVVHMLSHTDWERHDKVMADIFKASEAAGLEVWVDNWGIGGAPGDKSHFLAYHPEAHTYSADGTMHPYQICLNAPSYRQFVKDWVDEVASIGAKTVFWDEPHIPAPKVPGTNDQYYSTCCCPTCKAIFRERYGKEMPVFMDADVAQFRKDTFIDFFTFASNYAHEAGLKNVICVMPDYLTGYLNDGESDMLKMDISRLAAVPHLDNIGTDPYWFGDAEIAKTHNPYEYVYNSSKNCVKVAGEYKKEHNVWVQAYNAPLGREEEIITAFEAAYDGGARSILAWGFHACEGNNYRSQNPMRSWNCTLEGSRRIKSMERDRLLAENRKKFMK